MPVSSFRKKVSENIYLCARLSNTVSEDVWPVNFADRFSWLIRQNCIHFDTIEMYRYLFRQQWWLLSAKCNYFAYRQFHFLLYTFYTEHLASKQAVWLRCKKGCAKGLKPCNILQFWNINRQRRQWILHKIRYLTYLYLKYVLFSENRQEHVRCMYSWNYVL